MPVKGALGTSTKKIQSITCLLYPSVGFKQRFYGISCDIIIQRLFFRRSAGRYPKLASWSLLDPRIGHLQVSPMISIDLLSIYEYMDCIHDTDPPRKTDTFRQVINAPSTPSTPSPQHEVSALRTLIFSIISTTGSLMWTLVLLLLIFYCFSVAWYERLESARGMIGVCILYIDYIVVIPE